MGASISTSSNDIITKAITSLSSSVINESITKNDQSVVYKVKNVKGNVNFVNNKTHVVYAVDVQNLFTALNEKSNQNKLNSSIDSLVKSSIKGLNIGQLGASTNMVSQIVDNIIKIKDDTISKCKNVNNQKYALEFTDLNGNVNIQNNEVDLINKGIISCISSNTNKTELQSTTDLQLKTLTSTEVKGIDTKWFAIGIAAAAIMFGVVGGKTLRNLFGPIVMVIGSIVSYYGVVQKETREKDLKQHTHVSYLKKDTSIYIPSFKPYKTVLDADSEKNVTEYGEADLYELFLNNFTSKTSLNLYKMVNPQKITKISNDFDINDVNIKWSQSENNFLISVADSTKYLDVKFPIVQHINFPTGNVPIFLEYPIQPQRDLFVVAENFDALHRIKFYYQQKEIDEYVFPGTIFSYNQHEKIQVDKIPLWKSPMFMLGIGLIVVGAIITTSTAFKKNTIKTSLT